MNDYPPLRPMSTAPTDGTAFLASFPAGSSVARMDVRVLHWSGWGGGVWETDGGHKISDTPIGWRPLPPEEKGHWFYAYAGATPVWVGTDGTLARTF